MSGSRDGFVGSVLEVKESKTDELLFIIATMIYLMLYIRYYDANAYTKLEAIRENLDKIGDYLRGN